MKRFGILFCIMTASAWLPSCRDYLDIVPDNTLTLNNIFSIKDEAYSALAKSYSYMPRDYYIFDSSWLMGDEYLPGLLYDNNSAQIPGIRLMRGLQTTGSPLLGTWSGTGNAKPLYRGISICNIFLQHIDQVKDMETSSKAEWKAQVKFLKAYYHFLLLQQYGPIVIADKVTSADALGTELFVSRSKVDDCFDYIVKLMDEAIPDLMPRKDVNDLGQVDRMVAFAIKARVLLFRASPFYSGNMEYFGDFFDHDEKPIFPVSDDAAVKKAKWKDAVDAAEAAITFCLQNGCELYTYNKPLLTDDIEDFEQNTQIMQTYYDLRMLMADPWNKELIWGASNISITEQGSLDHAANIMLPDGYVGETKNNTDFSWNLLAATYRMAERYYTKNGIPIDEDKTFDRSNMHQITVTPGPEDAGYSETRGILQPKAEIINLYMNREMRFYANLGLTGTYWRSHAVRIRTQMYANTDGGYKSSKPNNFFETGIGVQKVVHISNKSGTFHMITRYPLPIIRLADLYLMKAEALNEYSDVPNQEVWDAINMVRRRAGIPDVETAYSNSSIVTAEALNKHTGKEGMRDIILQERSIELAFEGSRYWDMIRHKRAVEQFSSPILGWMEKTETGSEFFNLETKQARIFTTRDCLWPIDLNELNTNSNLIQNPGW
jgi:hypothetical protein